MRAWGFVSNRCFDALACATCVVSDHVDEIGELFEGTVATYSTVDELADHVERLLGDRRSAVATGRRGRDLVRTRHTFDHRAATILHVLERHGLQG
jgi:spore maturation protein CgeB